MKAVNYLANKKGFTLIEVLVALAIGASLVLLAYQALSGALNSEERIREVSQQTNDISRVWRLLGDDLQHVVARPWVDNLSNQQPGMLGLLGDRLSQSTVIASDNDNHLLRFVRSGDKNFFQQARSNLSLVGYRITVDDSEQSELDSGESYVSLWRDYWRPVDSAGEPTIKSRRLLDHIKTIRFRYLPKSTTSIDDQAWITGWPESTNQNAELPIAIEVSIDLADLGEIKRLFPLIASDQ